jgi:hypothetical protein
MPDLPMLVQQYAAVLFSKDLNAVCRKVGLSESCPT